MKKSFVVLLSAVLMTVCCSCTQSVSQSSVEDISSKATSSLNDVSKTESVSKFDADELREEVFYECAYKCPSNFEKSSYRGGVSHIYCGTVNTDFEVILFLEQDALEIDTDVPTAFKSTIAKIINVKYNVLNSKFSLSTENESDFELLGKKFIRRTGVVSTGYDEESDKVKELYYTAYYGFMDFSYYGYENQPMVIMSFSEGMDEQTKKDVEYVADTAFSSFRFLN